MPAAGPFLPHCRGSQICTLTVLPLSLPMSLCPSSLSSQSCFSEEFLWLPGDLVAHCSFAHKCWPGFRSHGQAS